MTLIITRRTIAVEGPGPYCMTDSEVAWVLDRAREEALLRRPPAEDGEHRPRNTARDGLARLAEAGDITPQEHRAGREIGLVSYITTQPARGRQVAGYAERTDRGVNAGPEAYLDMERRYRAWHDWAKREPVRPRHPASLADATLLVCVDGWGVTELQRRFGGRISTVLERLRLSLSAYCAKAGWPAGMAARFAVARAA
jgi:hypothetical protein